MKAKLLIVCSLAGAVVFGSTRPTFSGIWLLDPSTSTGNVPSYSSLSIEQNSKWFRSAQLDVNGRSEKTVESECKTDGRFHPVSSAEGGSVRCNWEGSVLVIEKHWNEAKEKITTRVSISPNGKLVQDVVSEGEQPDKGAHLVWSKKQ